MATAAAVDNGIVCQLDNRYVQQTATVGGTSCTGPATGYSVSLFCLNGATNVATTTIPITTANANQLRVEPAANAPVQTGCVFPSDLATVGAAGNFIFGATVCGAQPNSAFENSPTLKGVQIECDRANGFYPTMGVEGRVLCGGGTTGSLFQNTVGNFGGSAAAAGNAANRGAFVPLPGAIAGRTLRTDVGSTMSLMCNRGCVLPTTICTGTGTFANDGTVVSEVPIAAANRFTTFGSALNGCTVLPGRSVRLTNRLTNIQDTFTCTASTTAATAGTGVFTTGGAAGLNVFTLADGAITQPIIEPEVVAQTIAAGFDAEFPNAVVVIEVLANAVQAQFRQNVFTPFVNGVAFIATVTGCPAGAQRSLCVQKALNEARCRGLFLGPAAQCVAAGVRIPCPSHALGWRCHSSSKKGLLGLLGLLGLIPLLLCSLLLCCLLPCCLRRKKAEADVHFATFDPHAAPVAGSVVAAPTAVPVCAEPMPVCAPAPACMPVDPMMAPSLGAFPQATAAF